MRPRCNYPCTAGSPPALPIEAMRDAGQQIDVPAALLGNGEHYALEVAGDSMVDAWHP